jgi:hypothetical protein
MKRIGSLTGTAIDGLRITRVIWAAGLLAAWSAFGCTETLRVEQAQAGEKVPADAFLHEHLQTQPMVTVAEAYRATLMLAEGDDNYTDFEARRQALESRGVARAEWNLRPEASIDRGSVAYMVCQVMKVRGGINYNLFGRLAGIGDRRYAVRELAYLEIMTPAAPYRYITGGELVDVLAKADRYMAEHGMYPQPPVNVADTLAAEGSRDQAASSQPGR